MLVSAHACSQPGPPSGLPELDVLVDDTLMDDALVDDAPPQAIG